jgi:hypothetical protein
VETGKQKEETMKVSKPEEQYFFTRKSSGDHQAERRKMEKP